MVERWYMNILTLMSNYRRERVMIGLIKEANNGTETTYTDR
jgi:hypothetical protein